MPVFHLNNARQQTDSVGVGTDIILGDTVAGYQPIVQTGYVGFPLFCVEVDAVSGWSQIEGFTAILATSPNRLVRQSCVFSSNANDWVVWDEGTKIVFCTPLSESFDGQDWIAAASASTVEIFKLPANRIRLTGGNTINSFGTSPSPCEITIEAETGLTLAHSAALLCPGGSNLVLNAGDRAGLIYKTGGVSEVRALDRAGAWLDQSVAFGAAPTFSRVLGLPGTGAGFANVQPGDAGHSGYVEFMSPQGAQLGYVGYSDGTSFELVGNTTEAQILTLGGGVVRTKHDGHTIVSNQLQVGDTNHYTQLVGTDVYHVFDGTDYIKYDRATNAMHISIGGNRVELSSAIMDVLVAQRVRGLAQFDERVGIGREIESLSLVSIQSDDIAHTIHVKNTASDNFIVQWLECTDAAQGGSRYFCAMTSGTSGADNEFLFRNNGDAFADGAWNAGGADFAEYFEWADGNPNGEDRRGWAVKLVQGDQIARATQGETPIGVISARPTIVGNAAPMRWVGKYRRDPYGAYLLDEDGRRIPAAEFDSSHEYRPREERPEWDAVGLVGRLALRVGEVTDPRWIKLRDLSEGVAEWLLR